jgi:hypothetical protein
MTLLEAILILILAAVIVFAIYYFLKGSSGRIEWRRPMESRIDEYLDKKFEDLVSEWSLVNRTRVAEFEARNRPSLKQAEGRVRELKDAEEEVGSRIRTLEVRLDALEKELVPEEGAGTGRSS